MVYGAHSHQEFLTLCEHALEEPPAWVSQRRLAHGAAAAWSPPGRTGLPDPEHRFYLL